MAVDRVSLPQKQPVLRTVPMPADLNQNGDVLSLIHISEPTRPY